MTADGELPMTNYPDYRPGTEKPPFEDRLPDEPALNRRTFQERPSGSYALPALLGLLILLGLIFWYGGWNSRFMTASNDTTTTTTQKVNPPATQPTTQPPATNP
jgi:hypothetical protein